MCIRDSGNGARCFARYVTDKGLVDKPELKVSTTGGLMELVVLNDTDVTVRMGKPEFEPQLVPFVADELATSYEVEVDGEMQVFGVVSLGNPHAVCWVQDVQQAEVLKLGPKIECHPRFPNRVNAGFAQLVSRSEIRLRVFERGVGAVSYTHLTLPTICSV